MNHAAQQLGRLAKGKPKTLTTAERERRREWARGLAERRKLSKRNAQ